MRNSSDTNGVDPTPRWLPALCALLTLVGTIAWNPGVILLGLAVVGSWAPAAIALMAAAERLAAARFLQAPGR
jgi:hypothetical protein